MDALAIYLNLVCSQDATANVLDVKYSCRKRGGIMTHVVTSHARDTTECRILAGMPPPPYNLGTLVCVEFGDSTTAYLRPTLLKKISVTGEGSKLKSAQIFIPMCQLLS